MQQLTPIQTNHKESNVKCFKMQGKLDLLKDMGKKELITHAITFFDVSLSNVYGRDWLYKKVAYMEQQAILGELKGSAKTRYESLDKPEVQGRFKEEEIELMAKKVAAKTEKKSTKKVEFKDKVAEELAGMELEDVYGVFTKKLGIRGSKAKYAHLNPGMQRMNLGNRLRKLCKEQGVTSIKKLKKAA